MSLELSIEIGLPPLSDRVQSSPVTPSDSGNNAEEEYLEHSSAFPASFTCCGYLDIRENIDDEWDRKYFMVSNNFLVSATTHLSLKLEHIIYLESSTITSNTETSFKLFADKQTLHFRISSRSECEKWIDSIHRASKLKIKDIYRFLHILGESGMTKVVAAKHKSTEKESAIKIVDKRICNKTLLKTEIEILRKLDNEYIVNLYDVIETKKYLYIVMEQCEGGELFDQINECEFNEYDCCLIMHQIAHAVKYMHSMGIIHRDLKPENILCVKPHSIREIKIADFGISKICCNDNDNQCEDDPINTICTISYTSPEILKNKKYDFRTDYWSIGIILFILLCGYPPFYDESGNDNDEQIIKSIINDELIIFDDDDEWQHVSNETKNLLKGLLCKDAIKRKTCDDILKLVWKITNRTSSFEKARENLKQSVWKKNKKMNRSCSERRIRSYSDAPSPINICGDDRNIKLGMKSRSMQNMLLLLDKSSNITSRDEDEDEDEDEDDIDRAFTVITSSDDDDDDDVVFGEESECENY